MTIKVNPKEVKQTLSNIEEQLEFINSHERYKQLHPRNFIVLKEYQEWLDGPVNSLMFALIDSFTEDTPDIENMSEIWWNNVQEIDKQSKILVNLLKEVNEE